MRTVLAIIILSTLTISAKSYSQLLTAQENNHYSIASREFSGLQLIKDYSKIKQLNLIIDQKVQDFKMRLFGPLSLKAANLDKYIHSIFFSNGLSIIRNGDILRVVNSREIRYNSLKLITKKEKLPHNDSYVNFILKVKYISLKTLIRTLRPFLTRYGRISADQNSDSIMLLETANNIHRLIDIIDKLDTERVRKDQDKNKELNKKFAKMKERKTGTIIQTIDKNHILFAVLFSLIFFIIGFGLRGYLIKRIEGGL